MKLVIFWFSCLWISALSAQSYVLYSEVPATGAGGRPLPHAWAGGLNNPQFSGLDADGDGLRDLFVFDRQGNVPLVFIGDGSGEGGWTYSPHWSARFPRLGQWAVLRDLNCDGLEDLITWSQGGVVLRYASREGGLSFTSDTARLTYTQLGFTRILGVLDIDIPAFEDVDGDGDVDVLSFNLGGGYVEWFRNQAAENGTPCGPLDLVLEDACWGRFYESGVAQAVDLDTCFTGAPVERSGVHAGSTLMAFDENGDGLLELVLGDLSFNNLNRLLNGGSPESGLMVDQDTLYPAYDQPYLVHQFPAAFLADADQDGRRDMLVSPNSVVLGRDVRNVAYYRDVGTAGQVLWEFQTDDFLVGDMVEVGRGANPAFFDYDGDGLLDLAIGNSSYTLAVGNKVSQIALYRNTGTAEAPAFSLMTDDLAGISVFGFENVHPCFGDVDGDGDLDLLIGEEEGLLHLFINNPVGGEAVFSLSAPGWQGIDVGKTSTPQLIDLDRDGDLDLLIGERNGNLNYYRNEGSPTSPSFVLVSELFGGIDLRSGPINIGEVQPLVVEDPDSGQYRLYVGERTGRVWRYDNWESDLTADFALSDSAVGNLQTGSRSRVALADLNGDGVLELLIGNMRGGLMLFKEGIPSGLGTAAAALSPELLLYPNPARHQVRATTGTDGAWEAWISDLQGRLVAGTRGMGQQLEMSLSGLSPGLYRLSLRSSGALRSASLLIVQEP